MFEGKLAPLTDQIIKAFYKVYNTLGYGFREKVYENALTLELREMGLNVTQQRQIVVYYHRQVVGEYFADLVVEDAVVVEIKAAKQIVEEHQAQLLNYLKATTFEVGLLFNFGYKPAFKRQVFDNELKRYEPKA